MSIVRLDLRNSGDTAGPRDRVVGYAAGHSSSLRVSTLKKLWDQGQFGCRVRMDCIKAGHGAP
jgi:hypothetical protein